MKVGPGCPFWKRHRLFWAVNCWRNVWSTQLTTGQVALKRIWVTWTDCREAKSCGLVPNFPWNIFTVATQGTWISLWIFSINDQSVNHWSHVSLKELLCHFPIWRVSSAILVLRQRFPEEVEQGYLGLELCWCRVFFWASCMEQQNVFKWIQIFNLPKISKLLGWALSSLKALVVAERLHGWMRESLTRMAASSNVTSVVTACYIRTFSFLSSFSNGPFP